MSPTERRSDRPGDPPGGSTDPRDDRRGSTDGGDSGGRQPRTDGGTYGTGDADDAGDPADADGGEDPEIRPGGTMRPTSPPEESGDVPGPEADAPPDPDPEATEDLTLVEAVRDGLAAEMLRDDDVLVLGEDVAQNGGVFRATDGLLEAFGPQRVIDTPLAESGIVGAGIGLASHGLRPVAEIQFMGFVYPAFDQLVSHAARLRTRTRGEVTCPMVVRMPYGAGIRAPEHHSESTEAFFVHQPGLKVVVPSTPYDAKGLLAASIRDPDPVVFLEPKKLYRSITDAVPADPYALEMGEAAVRREGSDLTAVTYGAMVEPTMIAAEELAGEVDVEVIDLRTLSPLDRETVVDSFRKTGRAAVVHEAPLTGGVGAELSAVLQEEALLYQEAPVKRIAGFDTPVPLHALEDYYLPAAVRIEDGIREAVDF